MNREKKQLVVVSVLALMVVSVGAFQFLGGSPEPAPAPTEKKVEKATEAPKEGEKVAVKNIEFAAPLTKKDPFQIAPFAFTPPDEPKPPTVPDSTKLSPLPGAGGSGAKTGFNGGSNSFPGGLPPGGIEPAIVPEVPKFAYRLIGVVEGNYPAAVFADANGNQRLVEAGQGIGSSATILSISRDKVRVKFNAEVLTLSVGGNSSAK